MMSDERFIKKAIKKPGALSRQLDIPLEKNIPETLLRKIISAEAGDTITNPTKTGKKRIKVTRLLEQRANLALNLKSIKRKSNPGMGIADSFGKPFRL